MTPAEIAAMQADMLVGTPGDWYCHFGDNSIKCNCKYILAEYGGMGSIATITVCKEMEGAWGDDFGPPEIEAKANARRFTRVPRMEATIIALTETNAAQAAEIERLLKALADIITTNRLHGVTPNSAGKQIWFDGPSASIARAALEGTPK